MFRKNKSNKLKTTIYTLSILIVFVAFAQMSVITFIDYNLDYPSSDCYKSNMTIDARNLCESENKAAYDVYDNQNKEQNLYRFYVAIGISILTLLAVSFYKFKDAINYGLFGGLSLNIVFSLTYMERSYLTVAILFAMLIAIIWYIMKDKND